MTKRKTAAALAAASVRTSDRTETAAVSPPAASTTKAPRPETKMAALVAVLREPDGATIEQMQAVTGWQQHSVRGALAGALKHKFGLTIASMKEERGRVYRATPEAAA